MTGLPAGQCRLLLIGLGNRSAHKHVRAQLARAMRARTESALPHSHTHMRIHPETISVTQSDRRNSTEAGPSVGASRHMLLLPPASRNMETQGGAPRPLRSWTSTHAKPNSSARQCTCKNGGWREHSWGRADTRPIITRILYMSTGSFFCLKTERPPPVPSSSTSRPTHDCDKRTLEAVDLTRSMPRGTINVPS